MTRVIANNGVRTGFGGVIGRRGGAVEVRVCASLKIAADLRVKGRFRSHLIPVDNTAWRGEDHMRESMTLLHRKLHQGQIAILWVIACTDLYFHMAVVRCQI